MTPRTCGNHARTHARLRTDKRNNGKSTDRTMTKYRLAHYFATLPENSALCQGDKACELISRPELRQTDRHADEAKTDATETAVTGHLRPTGRRWPVAAISVSSAFAESARRSVCRNSGREGERAIWPDSVLFSGSVSK